MGSLDKNWLAVEIQSIDKEVDSWSEGLKESFKSLFDDPSQGSHEDKSALQATGDPPKPSKPE